LGILFLLMFFAFGFLAGRTGHSFLMSVLGAFFLYVTFVMAVLGLIVTEGGAWGFPFAVIMFLTMFTTLGGLLNLLFVFGVNFLGWWIGRRSVLED